MVNRDDPTLIMYSEMRPRVHVPTPVATLRDLHVVYTYPTLAVQRYITRRALDRIFQGLTVESASVS